MLVQLEIGIAGHKGFIGDGSTGGVELFTGRCFINLISSSSSLVE